MSADGGPQRPLTRRKTGRAATGATLVLALLLSGCSHAPLSDTDMADREAMPDSLGASERIDLARLHYVRALAYLARDNHQPALDELDLALALHELPEYYALRGHVRSEQAQYDEALADLDRALTLDPEHGRARFDRAMLAHARGDTSLAMEDITVALTRAPHEARFLGGRCVIGIAAGQPEEIALAYCEQALQQRPPRANALTARGQAYLLLHREREALSDFESALSEHPRHMRALYGRGLTRLRLGDAGGRLDLRNAIRQLPGAGREYLAPTSPAP